MNLLNKLVVFLLLAGVCAPVFSAVDVDSVELINCSVYSESDKEGDKEGDKKKEGEEEEPDCE